MQSTETRLNSLEIAARDLFYAQAKTEMALQELAAEMKDFKEEMMTFKEEMMTFKDHMEKFRIEAEKDRKEMNKKWGDLANKMGTLVEDIVIPGFFGLIKSCFGQDPEDIEYLAPRVRKRHPEKGGYRKEFDGLSWTDRYVFYNETKSNVNMKDIESFIENKEIVFDYFPEVRGRTLVPIFSSLFLEQTYIDALTSGGCYAMMMGEENMEIVNYRTLGPPRA